MRVNPILVLFSKKKKKKWIERNVFFFSNRQIIVHVLCQIGYTTQSVHNQRHVLVQKKKKKKICVKLVFLCNWITYWLFFVYLIVATLFMVCLFFFSTLMSISKDLLPKITRTQRAERNEDVKRWKRLPRLSLSEETFSPSALRTSPFGDRVLRFGLCS